MGTELTVGFPLCGLPYLALSCGSPTSVPSLSWEYTPGGPSSPIVSTYSRKPLCSQAWTGLCSLLPSLVNCCHKSSMLSLTSYVVVCPSDWEFPEGRP